MKVSDAYPSKYLKADDLNGQSTIVTIAKVEIEQLGQDNERKPVAYFEEQEKGLVLNKTNAEMIVHFTGQDDMDAWAGSKIGLYTTPVKFQGRLVDSIEVAELSSMTRSEIERTKAFVSRNSPVMKSEFDQSACVSRMITNTAVLPCISAMMAMAMATSD